MQEEIMVSYIDANLFYVSSLHHAGLTHRLSKFCDVETAKKQQYRQCLDKCHRTDAEVSCAGFALTSNFHYFTS